LHLRILRNRKQRASQRNTILFQELHLRRRKAGMRRLDLMTTMTILIQLIDSLCCHRLIFQNMLCLQMVNPRLTIVGATSSHLMSL
jgi:hypothetical protein